MESENQKGFTSKQPIKMEKPFECLRRFLAALVKEMMAPFSFPNHGWKHSEQQRKLNSQYSQLEEENLQKLEGDAVPVNTKRPRVVAPWPVAMYM